MNIPFLGRRREESRAHDAEGIGDLLADCDLLRSQALEEGVRLDDSAVSLERLDQMLPRWRGDEEILDWLGNDAGLYLGTVIVRTVPGAAWSIRPDGQPVVRLATGREFDVVASGHAWAADGAPELSQLYAEVAEA
ncbi:DUF6278 family protein [Streptomyces rochei]